MKRTKTFAARDRFGEKPFYYYEDEGNFIFASEMKALWAIGVDKQIDNKMLLNYITLGYLQNCIDKEQTFLKPFIHCLRHIISATNQKQTSFQKSPSTGV